MASRDQYMYMKTVMDLGDFFTRIYKHISYFPHYKAHLKSLNFSQTFTVCLIIRCALCMNSCCAYLLAAPLDGLLELP